MASCWKTELLRAVMASGSIGSGGRLACCCSWPQSALHNERQCLRRDVNVCATTNKASVDEKYTIDVADVLSLCLSVSLYRALSLSLSTAMSSRYHFVATSCLCCIWLGKIFLPESDVCRSWSAGPCQRVSYRSSGLPGPSAAVTTRKLIIVCLAIVQRKCTSNNTALHCQWPSSAIRARFICYFTLTFSALSRIKRNHTTPTTLLNTFLGPRILLQLPSVTCCTQI